MSTAVPSSPSLFSEPTRRVPGVWIAGFAAVWLGTWMAQLTPIQLLLPAQIEEQLKTDDWVQNVLAFGVISAIAGVCAIFAFPVTGTLSDRTTSRFGRRRPWILAGSLVFAISLVFLGVQTSIVGIGVFWSLALIGFCMLTAAVTATISDQVPVNQRGFVSAWVSAPQAIGTILGLVLVVALALSTLVGYIVVAVVLVVLTLPFLFLMKDAPLPRADRPPLSAADFLSGLWINPRKHPDFGWTLAGRILVNIGNALGTTLLLYFLEFGLGFSADDAQTDLIFVTATYLVLFVISALIAGRISDRVGRRKMFVYIAAYLQAGAALILALAPVYAVTFVAAALLGLGYGSFMAVDQALATQVLPDAHSRGKDLGIMNIATAAPQAFGPLIGALVVTITAGIAAPGVAYTGSGVFPGATAGFAALFVASAVTAVLGGLAVIRIKSVK